jgi:hypothetical protein
MDAQQRLQKTEAKFDREFHSGDTINASINLQTEFEKNPREALAIIQREQRRESTPGNQDKAKITVTANGDVFVYGADQDKLYAGTIPKDMMAPAAQAAPPVEQPVPPAPPLPPTADVVPQGGAVPPADRGFHIPFPIDIGVRDGSLHLGVDLVGLVKAGVTLGGQNRGYVGSDVLGSELSAGVDLNGRHIGPAADVTLLNGDLIDGHARVGIDPGPRGAFIGGRGDVTALDETVQAGTHGGLQLGRRNGPDAGAYGYVGPVGAEANGHAYLSGQGLRAGVHAETQAGPIAGAAVDSQVAVGTRNEAHIDGRTNLGPQGVETGIGLYDSLRPGAYVRGYSTDDPDY